MIDDDKFNLKDMCKIMTKIWKYCKTDKSVTSKTKYKFLWNFALFHSTFQSVYIRKVLSKWTLVISVDLYLTTWSISNFSWQLNSSIVNADANIFAQASHVTSISHEYVKKSTILELFFDYDFSSSSGSTVTVLSDLNPTNL